MTIEDILTNENLRREEFPVTNNKIFLAHAAVCPLPARVLYAVNEYAQRAAQSGQFGYLHSEIEAQTRGLAAKLLGSSPEEIAFVSCTSAGLSTVAAGIDWKKGDNVIIAHGDFPANIYPWLNLERRGVQVKFIPRKPDDFITAADLDILIDENTRLVSLPTVHFVTGIPLDLATIGKFLREKGIFFCVDAIQSLGALPCSAEYVDFLAADAHKWLLGPQGIGILFVRREHFDKLHPAVVGWRSVRKPDDYLKIEFEFPPSAKRYESGSLNILGIMGLHAALSIITEVGIINIAEQLKKLRNKLIDGLRQIGCTILGIGYPNLMTGITSFKCAGRDIPLLYQQLIKKKIEVSLREDFSGDKCIRISPHFYNTDEEISLLLENIQWSTL